VQWCIPVIPSYMGGWHWEDHGLRAARAKMFSQPHLNGRKVTCSGARLLSQQWLQAWNRRIRVQAGLDKKQDPIFKITRVKRGLEAWLKM
jgi:hypothetical protein